MSPKANIRFEQSKDSKQPSTSGLFDDHFKIIKAIGRGHQSIVYLARKIAKAPNAKSYEVALKVLTGTAKNSEDIKQRMKREAVALLTARHENIVHLFDFVSSHEHCYLSLEHASGGDLFKLLETRPQGISQIKAVSFLIQALKGLEVIHNAGIIHRDIKPENLLLTEEGVIKIADFGIAKLPDELIQFDEEEQKGLGTFDYLAPELLDDGEYTAASDIYALGVSVFQLLTKTLPFEDVSIARAIQRKLTDERPRLSEIIPGANPKLENLIDKALSPKLKWRFSSAEEFRLQAEEVLQALKDEKTRQAVVVKLSRSSDLNAVSNLPALSDEFQPQLEVTAEKSEQAKSPNSLKQKIASKLTRKKNQA